jgi:hypothetical protein
MNQIDAALSKFSPDDYTVRLCNVIFGSIPFAPKQAQYTNMQQAIEALFPAATPQVASRAYQLAGRDEVGSALWMASALDTGDAGIAVYSGVKSAVGYFFCDRQNAFETDTQQGIDSAMKFLGIAYSVMKLFPGGIAEKIGHYHSTPAGQGISFYYAAIEVALPFADNIATGGSQLVKQLMDKYGSSAAGKLGPAGAGAAAEAQQAVVAMMGPVQGVVTQVGPHSQTIAQKVKDYLPGVANATDKIAGAVATAADALPVYRYLGARLACESCILLASKGM